MRKKNRNIKSLFNFIYEGRCNIIGEQKEETEKETREQQWNSWQSPTGEGSFIESPNW